MASSSSNSAAATTSPQRRRHRPLDETKIDWHAVATREFARKNWRQAAAAWSRALALVPITEQPHLELERMLYLGNRSLAYFQCGWLALARDDIESVLRMQYVYDGASLSVEPAGRTVVFAVQIAEYRRLVRTTAITAAAVAAAVSPPLVAAPIGATAAATTTTPSTAAATSPTVALPSWIESLGHFRTSGTESPTLVYDRLMQRTLRDVERLGRVLEAFGATKAAAAVYTLLGGVDRRSGDARTEWAKRAAAALAPKSLDHRASQSLVEPLWDAWSDWQQASASFFSSATTDASSSSQASENESRGATESKSAALPPPPTEVKEEEESEDRVLWTASIGLPVSVPTRSGDSPSVTPENRPHRAPEPDLECRRTNKYGRGIYARVDMLPGDAVWTERPLVAATGVEAVCGHCHRRVEYARVDANKVGSSSSSGSNNTGRTPTVCRAVHCRAIYCSTTCRSADASVHAELCAPEFALGEWRRRMSRGTSLFTAVLALKLLAHMLADRRRVADAESPDRERQGLPTYPPVCGSDDTHVREWMRGIGDTAAEISASSSDGAPDTTILSMSAGALYQLYDLGRVVLGRAAAPSSAAPTGVAVARFPAALHPQVYNIANYYAAMRLASAYSACFLVGAGDDGKSATATPQFGYGLYPIASVFNHSCAPNVACHFAGERVDERGHGEARDFMVCVATRAVKKGEQLFVSYCDEDDTYKNRTRWLRANRDLTCDCAKCCAKL